MGLIKNFIAIFIVWYLASFLSKKAYGYLDYKFDFNVNLDHKFQIALQLGIPFVILILLSFLPFFRYNALTTFVLMVVWYFVFGSIEPLAFL